MFIYFVFSLTLSARLLFCNLVCLNKWKLQIGHYVICYHNYYNKLAFLCPISSKIKLTDEKERRKRRSEEEERRGREKSNGCTVSFYIKLLDGEGPFASNAFKNPARYKYFYKLTMFVWGWTEMIPN